MKEVERTYYLNILEGFRANRNFIKVITGVRRSGKSTLINQYMRKLMENGVPECDIFSWNLEEPDNMFLNTGEKLAETVFSTIPRDTPCYVFFDEIQRAEGWENVINAIMAGTKADIYITGSNSKILSSELSTFLSGRHVSIHMMPLSFKEWSELRGGGDDASFRKYMVYGGFPAMDPDMGTTPVRAALRDLYGSIVTWDIAIRGKIRNPAELNRLMSYMMSNIGNRVSVSKITNELGCSREQTDKYLDLMEKSYILYRADPFDISSSRLNPTPKYYSVDPGLRDMAIGFTQADTGRVLENIIFLELKRRYERVQVGTFGSKEVDFVAFDDDGRHYFQVCETLNGESTREREYGPLMQIKDSFEKIILTMDPVVANTDPNGIKIRYVVDWLMSQ